MVSLDLLMAAHPNYIPQLPWLSVFFPNLIWRASVLHIELQLVAEAEAAVQTVEVNWI